MAKISRNGFEEVHTRIKIKGEDKGGVLRSMIINEKKYLFDGRVEGLLLLLLMYVSV